MNLPYWFSIKFGNTVHGGAFLITCKYALTAAHCLPRNFCAASDSDHATVVQLECANGSELLAIVSEADGDLALLEVAAFRKHDIVAPALRRDPVEKDSHWEAPYRPSAHHPTLTGTVGNPDLMFQSADGAMIAAIQLTVAEELGDHSGYSGGPVVSRATPKEAESILGVLIEQLPDQVNQSRAANVLFAARITCAFARFAAFDFADKLGVSVVSPPGNVSETLTTLEVGSRLDEADEILRRAKRWSEQSYINEYDYRSIKARVRNLIFSQKSTGSRP